jgi:hypothetical protein
MVAVIDVEVDETMLGPGTPAGATSGGEQNRWGCKPQA